MKTMFFILLVFSQWFAQAQTMDVETHNMLIEKLEQAMGQDSEPSFRLRLADLYADRSRLKTLKENEENCQQCHQSNNDRKKALKLYIPLFDQLSNDDKKRVFEQIVQAYTLLGEFKESETFYRKTLKKRVSKEIHGLAQLGLADQAFFAHRYEQAHKDYKKAVAYNTDLKTPVVRYRMAWCEFNAGKFEIAKSQLSQLLASPELTDTTLRSEISRDYAKFTAKGDIHRSNIQKVYQLSPKDEAKSNVELLASELDRLGRSNENILVNVYILETFATEPADKAMAYLRMAQASLSLKNLVSANDSFQKSIQSFSQINCKKTEELCQDYQSKAEKFIVFWSRTEKDNPSQQLHNVMISYLNQFQGDDDLHLVAAQSFHVAKKLRLANEYYLKTAQLVHKEKETPAKLKMLNISLDAAMSAAEESKNNNLKRESYAAYIKLHPEGNKRHQAEYQLAYIDYDEKKYEAARNGFNKIVVKLTQEKQHKDRAIALQSAHLILDIYALEKNNLAVMEQAQSLSHLFPQNKNEFDTIYRKALLNESLASLKKSPLDEKHLNNLIQRIQGVAVGQMNKDEAILLTETRLRMARATRNLNEVSLAAVTLLNFKNLKDQFKNYAYDQAIWAAEMTLNYKKALDYSLIRFKPQQRTKAVAIRLAVLAELAQQNAAPFYQAALKQTKGTLESNQIRAKMIQLSSRPWQMIKDNHKALKRSPLLYSELALETYARYNNQQGAKTVLSEKSLASRPAGVRLQRHLEIPEFKKLESRLTKHTMSHRSEQRAQQDIAERLKRIGGLEAFTNKAIDRKDIILQAAALEVLRREKTRFARDLTNLPLPKGLNQRDQIQYLKLLETKVAGFEREAMAIGQQLSRVWQNGQLTASIAQNYDQSSIHLKKLIRQEVEFLSVYTPDNLKSELAATVEKPLPDSRTLFAHRESVKAHPFDESALKKLLGSEKEHGNLTQVAFLEQRLVEMQKRYNP